MNLRSLLDLDLPPLADAERRLADLAGQRSRRLAAAVVLAALAVAAAVLIPQVSFPLAAGAVAAFAAGVTAVGRRRSLLSGLVQVRAAYQLRAVSEDGVRFANVDRRHRLARWLRIMVHAAEGSEQHPAYTATAIEERVLAQRERLLALAVALESPEQELHPAGVAIVHRLLTRPSLSPLYNPALGEDILEVVLHRVEACRDRTAA